MGGSQIDNGFPTSQPKSSLSKHYRSTMGGLEFWSPRYLKDLVTEKIQMIDYQRALEIFQPVLFLSLFRAVSIARAEYLMNSRVRPVSSGLHRPNGSRLSWHLWGLCLSSALLLFPSLSFSFLKENQVEITLNFGLRLSKDESNQKWASDSLCLQPGS